MNSSPLTPTFLKKLGNPSAHPSLGQQMVRRCSLDSLITYSVSGLSPHKRFRMFGCHTRFRFHFPLSANDKKTSKISPHFEIMASARFLALSSASQRSNPLKSIFSPCCVMLNCNSHIREARARQLSPLQYSDEDF